MPKAAHINRVCNEKIKNLPEDFEGYFVIEESYYEIGGRKNILPHLFLFNLNEEGKSVSDFGNGLIFTLQERTSEGGLEVSEIFEKNGKKTFGFDKPIIYKRVKK